MIRVLHIQLDSAMGGIESFLLSVYQNINKEKVQFDFVEYGEKKRTFNNLFISLGARIYNLPNRKKHPYAALRKLKKIITTNGYRIVHFHKNSLSDISSIRLCKSIGVPCVIIHSHNSCRDSKLITILHHINRRLYNIKWCNKFACSKKASEWMFGKFDSSIRLINNGIDVKRFEWSSQERDNIRAKLNISENDIIIGNVGRLSEQKNPNFLITVLHEIRKINPNYKLVWVGDGELKQSVLQLSQKLGEEKNVILTGRVSNPETYYQGFDVFVMPSFYEGFPIAAIEAQTSGLPCFLSDSITEESSLTPNMSFLSINDGPVKWANSINNAIKRNMERKSYSNEIRNKGFDIKMTSKYLQSFYLSYKE